ncbi:spidroin-1-like [Iris pallida]|uniref:Spidroin-1-like n=1 Tax=Iris pallida TaxID=29817 RepID=A0AAX6GDC5_IRIPA|nr:spidroin-1-like [Iris pallida]
MLKSNLEMDSSCNISLTVKSCIFFNYKCCNKCRNVNEQQM